MKKGNRVKIIDGLWLGRYISVGEEGTILKGGEPPHVFLDKDQKAYAIDSRELEVV